MQHTLHKELTGRMPGLPTNTWSRRTLGILFFLLGTAGAAWAQPTVLGTQVVNGGYTTYDLADMGGFRQVRLVAASSAASGARVWEFASGTAASPNYSTNWRPFTSGQTLGYNQAIDPAATAASARYNTSFGGASGLLPVVGNGNNYTFNITKNTSSSNTMAVLETVYAPVTVTSVTQSPLASAVPFNGAVTVTANLGAAPNAAEYFYIRYSTNTFGASTVAAMTVSGTTATATIPAQLSTSAAPANQNPTVIYYVFSSNTSTAPAPADVDMLTLNLGNNGGANYSYTYQATGFTGAAPTISPTTPAYGAPVTVTAALNAAPTAGEFYYLVYSADDFTTQTALAAPVSGTTVAATVPNVSSTANPRPTVKYYFVMSSANTAANEISSNYTFRSILRNSGNDYFYNYSTTTLASQANDAATAAYNGTVPATLTLGSTPAATEYFYLVYSTDNFATRAPLLGTVSGTTVNFTIPAALATAAVPNPTVRYYYLSSPASTPTAVTSSNYAAINSLGSTASPFTFQYPATGIAGTVRSPSGTVAYGAPVTVTSTLSRTPDATEKFYLRYSPDGFVNSTIVAMPVSGTSISATIPGFTSGSVAYYVYSSPATTQAGTYTGSAGNFAVLRIDNNGGPNYTYSITQTTFVSVTQSPAAGAVPYGNAVTVTATLSNAPGAGEYVYLRYATAFNFSAGNTVVAMAPLSAGSSVYTAVIPNLTSVGNPGPTVYYYALTSTSAAAAGSGDPTSTTLNQGRVGGNNAGANFSYTYNTTVFVSVTQSPAAAAVPYGTPVTVTATLAAAPQATEYVYLRYATAANFSAGNTVVAMTPLAAGSSVYTASIPNQAGSTIWNNTGNILTQSFTSPTISYYALTSRDPAAAGSGNPDPATLNQGRAGGNNAGANFAYQYQRVTIPTITRSPDIATVGVSVTVAVTLSAAPGAGEFVYLRYAYDNSFTQSETRLTMTGSGTGPYTATIPGAYNAAGKTVSYYAFTHFSSITGTSAGGTGTYAYNNTALSANNNGSGNYSYTIGALCGTAYTINNANGLGTNGLNFNSFTDAFTALNTYGITCNTVFNVTGNYAETPPALGSTTLSTGTNGAGGFTLTFQRDAAATANPKITAAGGAGTDDAALKIAGTDNVTFDRIDLASTGTALEYGLALRHLTVTDGAQRNTYKGGTITMDKAYASTCVDFAAKSATGPVLASTSAAGANSANTLTGNTFTNATFGVQLDATPGFKGLNNVVGTTTAGQGNTITDFGVLDGAAGVNANNQDGLSIAGNTLTSTAAATSGNTNTLNGINLLGANSGTLTVNANSVTVSSGATTNLAFGIRNQASATNVVISNNNPITLTMPSYAGNSSLASILNTASPTTLTISGNTITGMSIGGTSSTMIGIEGGSASCATTTMTISGNTVQNCTKPAAGGSFYLIRYSGVTNNVFNNTLTNCGIAGGSGEIRGISNVGANAGTTAENIYGNILSNLTHTGSIDGIRMSNSASSSTRAVYQNTIFGLATSAASSNCRAVFHGVGGASGGTSIFRNKIYGLSAGTTSGNAVGIGCPAASGAVLLANNVIGNLTAPAASGLNAVLAFDLSAAATYNLYHNTVALSAASSSNTFGSAVAAVSASTVLNPRNNVFVNASTPGSTTGSAAVYTGVAPTVSATADNNLYYAGTPGVRNYLYYSGTGTVGDQTLAAYKTRVGPAAEANSATENIAFASTTGADATFLSPDLTRLTQAANGGTAIAAATVDYNGSARSATTPDMGAYEVAAVPFDVALTALNAPTGSQCPGSAPQAITATITNLAALALTTSATAVLTVTATLTRPDASTVALSYAAPAATVLAASTGTLSATLTPAQTFDQIGTYTFGNLTATLTDGQTPASPYREANTANNTLSPSPTLVVLGTSTWTGAASSGSVTDWFNPGNWSGCVPTLQLNALVPNGVTNMPVINSATGAVARSLTIQGSSTVGVAGASSTLTLAGDLVTPAASAFAATAGTVSFAGAAAQNIGAGTFFNLAVSGAAAKVVTGPATVNGTLNLSAGLLQLGAADLVLGGSTSTISGADAAHFVVQTGAGSLCIGQVGSVGRPSAAFPVGTAPGSYTPATLANTGTADTYCVRVSNGISRQGNAVTANVVNRTWDVSEATAGGSTATLTLQWNAAEEIGGFARSKSAVAHYENNAWNSACFTCYGPATAGTVAGSYRQSRAGITSFSPFGVQDNAKPLPVSLTRFAATRREANAELAWATASEQNNAGFDVQVSADGRAFRTLHAVEPASANSAAPRYYTYTDREAGKTGLRYYRLAQRDVDGPTTYSEVRTVAFDKAAAAGLSAAPNPFRSELTLTVTNPAAATAALLTLTDAAGRTVLTQRLALPTGPSPVALTGLDKLPAGVYLLHLPLHGQTLHLKVVKE